MSLKRATLAILAITLLALPARSQSLKGTWVGQYQTSSSGTGELTIVIDSTKNGWSLAVQSRSEYSPPNPQFTPATYISIKGDTVSWTLNWGPQVVTWIGRFNKASFAGNVEAEYWTGTWSAKREAPAKP